MEKEAVISSFDETNMEANKNNTGTKIIIRFIYLLFLFSFFYITFAYVGGEISFVKFSLLNILWALMIFAVLAVAVTLSLWKWYVGAIFADIIAFFVNRGLEGGGYNLRTLGFTLMELPVFFGIAAVIYFVNKGYEKIPKREMQLTIAIFPFIILLLLIIAYWSFPDLFVWA